jgi:hypothetical protein
MRSKAKINSLHAKRRLQQRYGIHATDKLQRHLINIIRTTSGKFAVEKQSLTRTLYKIPYNDIHIFTVYDKKHKSLVTVLTERQGRRHMYAQQ